jgi:hypothetical protein
MIIKLIIESDNYQHRGKLPIKVTIFDEISNIGLCHLKFWEFCQVSREKKNYPREMLISTVGCKLYELDWRMLMIYDTNESNLGRFVAALC